MDLKRRRFIQITTLASLGLPALSMRGVGSNQELNMISQLTLKGFNEYQEEAPSIVTDLKGNLWLFTLTRLGYPKREEFISAFYYNGKQWVDIGSVSKSNGAFECPVSSCPKGGLPVVAWAKIKDKKWQIQVSPMGDNGLKKVHTFDTVQGNSIHPVMISPAKDRHWLAWENLHKGKFSIYISQFQNGSWTKPFVIKKGENSCFSPALAEDKKGDLYVAYGLTEGFHQNIELAIFDGKTLKQKKSIPVALGGGHENRVNINANPALAFDRFDNLWISYENNRNSSRIEDGDNYTGDRTCSILTYKNGKIYQIKGRDKWLFSGHNDHHPTFVPDTVGNLYLISHCGGDFNDSGWKYRISWLDPATGWQDPVTFFDAKIKGGLLAPALAFEEQGKFWLSTINEQTFNQYKEVQNEGIERSRLTELNLLQFETPVFNSNQERAFQLQETRIREYMADETNISTLSGHPRVQRRTMTENGTSYTLICGNLHEHSNGSNCWPAGTDGSLHDDYRFGMYTEDYDFFGMTDHAASTTELYWRKSIRIADFYNESKEFVAIPAIEWTLQSDPKSEDISPGAGHYNVIFKSSEDAYRYVRNRHELYCPRTPESKTAPMLWKLLHEKNIQCVTIPHHTADQVHPVDWNVTDPKYVTTVELFQCRGNNEYPGCPRERNLSRHVPTHHKHAYVDFALREKKYKIGFIASGDHNSMGIGLAALWVKEISRAGIIEALQSRRVFATTGDKIFLDFRVNGAMMGTTVQTETQQELKLTVEAQYPLNKVEILRNSEVIKEYKIANDQTDFEVTYLDKGQPSVDDVLYYYIRATQKNKALAWSSPIWVEQT